MKVHRQKAGRSADANQRERASRLVEMYAQAKASPDGRYCVNPSDPEEERSYLDYSDPSLLLGALTVFVAHGTFTDPFEDGVTDMILLDQFQKMRAEGISYEKAIAQMANEHATTEKTIERRVSPTKRGSDCR
jgi:hypothetical protein